jgi:RecA/RadA recombinase
MLSEALALAALGLRVVPLHRPDGSACSCRRPECRIGGKSESSVGKHPRIENWGPRATSDAGQVRDWWAMYPDSNVGVVAGHELPGGGFLVILDVDPRNGGDESLQVLVSELGPLPETACAISGGGGPHYYLRSPVPLPSCKPGPGLDLQAGAGETHNQVVAPPSLHKSGRRYEWELSSDPRDGVPIAPLPEAWLEHIQRGMRQAGGPATFEPGAPILDGDGGQNGIGRKATLISHGRSMWSRGCARAEIAAALTTMNDRCVPPLDARDLTRTIDFVVSVPPGRSPAYESRGNVVAMPAPRPEPKPSCAAAVSPAANDGPPPFRSAADWARMLGGQGSHLLSGFKTFDEATRGGPRLGDLIVIGGAPGAGKTTWLCNLAVNYCARGAYVAILAADEAATGLLMRIGQGFGFDRDALEKGDPTTCQFLAAQVASDLPNLLLADATDGHTVEAVSAELHQRAKAEGKPAVLVVDSVQTVPAIGTAEAENPRARVDAAVAALKRAAGAGALVLASCELNRGSYGKSDPSQRTPDLAAFKESGAVEYGATAALVLRSVADSHDLVDATFAKNRIGTRMEFRLQLDRLHATFNEVALPALPDAEEQREANARATFERVRELALATVRGNAKLTTKSAIVRAMGPGRKQTKLDAVESLLGEGAIALVGGSFRVVPPGSRAPEPPLEAADTDHVEVSLDGKEVA